MIVSELLTLSDTATSILSQSKLPNRKQSNQVLPLERALLGARTDDTTQSVKDFASHSRNELILDDDHAVLVVRNMLDE